MKTILKTPHSFLIILFLILSHNLALAKVYKCKGADGNIEYRQTACPVDTEENKMDHLNYKTPEAAPNDNPVAKLKAVQEKQDKVDVSDAALARANKEEGKGVCKTYTERLAKYKREGIMGYHVLTGKTVKMTGQRARDEMKKTEEIIDEFCP